MGAKWSTLYTEIPKAEATGKLDLRPQSMVLQIQHDDAGKVTGVLYADEDGKQQVQKGRIVCVACNSIESPRLLLNSASAKFPDGLANSSGQVGRNYMRHTTGSVYAIFDEPVHMYRGTTMAGIILDEHHNDPSRGFVGGYEFETLSLGLPFMAAFLDPGRLGPRLRLGAWRTTRIWPGCGSSARTCRRRATASPCTPTRRTALACRSRTSTTTITPTTSRCATTLTSRAGRCTRRSAPSGSTRRRPIPSTHNLGTCRQSANPRDGVCNRFGQTHDIDNLFISDGSQYTTGAAENPTLTIVTLAIRQADYIADQMSKGDI